MTITAQDVNKLRKMTGAGMMDCKKALVEADGDFEKAIELLRKKGQKVFAARADKATTEGVIFVKTNDEATEGVIVGLVCETDFVAKNEEFQTLGKAILDVAFNENSADIDTLKKQKLGDLTVEEKVLELVGRIGEKLEITSYETLKGEKVIPYIHSGSKLGVLVALKGVNGSDVEQAGKDVAMQIAAMNPIAVDRDDIDQSVIDKEMEIGKEQARQEGKPENILDRIAEGKVNKYLKDNTLLNQAFVKDNKITVGVYLKNINNSLSVSAFKRVNIG